MGAYLRFVPVFGWFCLLAILAGILLALSRCASAPAVSCPRLRAYSSLEQTALADELPRDGIEAQEWIADYLALRARCRRAATDRTT